MSNVLTRFSSWLHDYSRIIFCFISLYMCLIFLDVIFVFLNIEMLECLRSVIRFTIAIHRVSLQGFICLSILLKSAIHICKAYSKAVFMLNTADLYKQTFDISHKKRQMFEFRCNCLGTQCLCLYYHKWYLWVCVVLLATKLNCLLEIIDNITY